MSVEVEGGMQLCQLVPALQALEVAFSTRVVSASLELGCMSRSAAATAVAWFALKPP